MNHRELLDFYYLNDRGRCVHGRENIKKSVILIIKRTVLVRA